MTVLLATRKSDESHKWSHLDQEIIGLITWLQSLTFSNSAWSVWGSMRTNNTTITFWKTKKTKKQMLSDMFDTSDLYSFMSTPLNPPILLQPCPEAFKVRAPPPSARRSSQRTKAMRISFRRRSPWTPRRRTPTARISKQLIGQDLGNPAYLRRSLPSNI